MNIAFPGSLDTRREIRLVGALATEHQAAWRPDVTAAFELFARFVSVGALCRVVEAETQTLTGRLEWERGGFVCAWSQFPFDTAGLGIILRMLGHLRHGDAAIESVSVEGTSVEPKDPAASKRIEDIMDGLPDRTPSLPFELELCPSGPWISLECEVTPSFQPDVSLKLHEAIGFWGGVANAGGFQAGPVVEGATDSDSFGVGIDGPTVGDDFVEWQCLMTGVPAESLRSLVNILGHFSGHIWRISRVYIG